MYVAVENLAVEVTRYLLQARLGLGAPGHEAKVKPANRMIGPKQKRRIRSERESTSRSIRLMGEQLGWCDNGAASKDMSRAEQIGCVSPCDG